MFFQLGGICHKRSAGEGEKTSTMGPEVSPVKEKGERAHLIQPLEKQLGAGIVKRRGIGKLWCQQAEKCNVLTPGGRFFPSELEGRKGELSPAQEDHWRAPKAGLKGKNGVRGGKRNEKLDGYLQPSR